MSYNFITDDGQLRVENPDGEIIYGPSGEWSMPSEGIADPILSDAGFGSRQRQAIKAVLGIPDVETDSE